MENDFPCPWWLPTFDVSFPKQHYGLGLTRTFDGKNVPCAAGVRTMYCTENVHRAVSETQGLHSWISQFTVCPCCFALLLGFSFNGC